VQPGGTVRRAAKVGAGARHAWLQVDKAQLETPAESSQHHAARCLPWKTPTTIGP